MSVIGQGVRVAGIHQEDSNYTLIVDDTNIAEYARGIPVSLKAATNLSVETAPDAAEILGVLQSCEDRKIEGIKVGTVELHGGFELPYSGTVAVGDHLVGAGSGEVRTANPAVQAEVDASRNNIVVSVDTTAVTCQVLFK